MKRLTLFVLMVVWCVSALADTFIDDLVVKNLNFTNSIGATVRLYMFGNYTLVYTNSEGPGSIEFNRDGVIFADGFRAGSIGNGAFQGDGSGLTNILSTNIVGTIQTVGLTTNFDVVFANTGLTNTLSFTNGLLASITGMAPPAHGPSIVLPGGGYLIQPGGSTLLLP